jgi:hypothetical protein
MRANQPNALRRSRGSTNSASLKAYIAMTEKDIAPRDLGRPKAEPKLGKKEQALVDAKTAPNAGGWAAVVRH